MLLFRDGADGSLLEVRELDARGEDKAVVCDSGVAPELLDWSLHTVDGDDNIGTSAGLVIGKLECSCQRLPARLGRGRGECDGGEERRSKRGGVGEVHFECVWKKVDVMNFDFVDHFEKILL